jgi:predicted nucleic acid-binding protein
VRVYFDTAYVAKCYLNEPDHAAVRRLARKADGLYSSSLCIAEFACLLHRRVREGSLTKDDALQLRAFFLEDCRNTVWALIPVTNQLLLQIESRVSLLPAEVLLRAGDAIHLVSASAAGFTELWTSDRRLLDACRHFSMTGRSV